MALRRVWHQSVQIALETTDDSPDMDHLILSQMRCHLLVVSAAKWGWRGRWAWRRCVWWWGSNLGWPTENGRRQTNRPRGSSVCKPFRGLRNDDTFHQPLKWEERLIHLFANPAETHFTGLHEWRILYVNSRSFGGSSLYVKGVRSSPSWVEVINLMRKEIM